MSVRPNHSGDRRPPHGAASRRPAPFRPRLEALEDRCLLSAGHRLHAPPSAVALGRSAAASVMYTDTLQAKQTGHGATGSTHYADLSGKLSGGLPGDWQAHVLYTQAANNGPDTIVGGTWSVTVRLTKGHTGAVQGKFTGGSVKFDSTGKSGKVSITFSVTGGSGIYARYTGSGTFQGTLDTSGKTVSGTMTFTLTAPKS
jgi:hypothetical protein